MIVGGVLCLVLLTRAVGFVVVAFATYRGSAR